MTPVWTDEQGTANERFANSRCNDAFVGVRENELNHLSLKEESTCRVYARRQTS
jgi:hypothetical protein